MNVRRSNLDIVIADMVINRLLSCAGLHNASVRRTGRTTYLVTHTDPQGTARFERCLKRFSKKSG